MEDGFFTIDCVARRFGVSYRTLRFYEQRGIVSPERHGSRRLYSGRDCVKLELVFKGKKLGFTLSEIEALIGAAPLGHEGGSFLSDGVMRSLGRTSICEQLQALETRKTKVEEAISELSQVLARRRCR